MSSANDRPLSLPDAVLIASPITMPCGRVMRNRLTKAAMYEHLATFGGGPPNDHHIYLYSKWSRGGWGMIITGNFQISSSHLTLGRDITFPPSSDFEKIQRFKALSAAIHSGDAQDSVGTLAIMQVSHSGRQSPRFIGGRLGTFHKPLAPSSRRVGYDTREGWLAKVVYKLLFETPATIKLQEIERVIEGFVRAAQVAFETGFDGIQLHASHGYLLSQFLSPRVSILVNTRSDEYGDVMNIIRRIIHRIRSTVSPKFVLGIKLNAGDYVSGGLSVETALDHVRELAFLGVDFIEISGGDYENPSFLAPTSPRQAYFSSFSRLAVAALPSSTISTPLIMLTGSLRTPQHFSNILRQNHAHLLGFGRLSVLCPDLPRLISPASISWMRVDSEPKPPDFPLPEPRLFHPQWFPKFLGAGAETAWYTVGIRNLASNKAVDVRMGSLEGFLWMWCWVGPPTDSGKMHPFIWVIIPSLICAWIFGILLWKI